MDARYYNGDLDNQPRLRSEPRQREEPAASDYYGRPCGSCGRTCHRIYTLADVGIFCSPGCRQKATEPKQATDAA
jgi:hypothetical protein